MEASPEGEVRGWRLTPGGRSEVEGGLRVEASPEGEIRGWR